MVFFNYATMQMAAKIVYYGPGLCGKTTNLHWIYAKTAPQSRGEMVSLETETDRTLFFDLLPIDVGMIGGFKTRLQLYTIPGQVFYNTTRKLVLKGVDGVVFVADLQKAMLEPNLESFRNLRENLNEIGTDLDELPLVLQFNKKDLPNIIDREVLLDALDKDRRYKMVESAAVSGEGVFETLKEISKLTLRTLRTRMMGDEGARRVSRPPAITAQVAKPADTRVGFSPPPAPTIARGTQMPAPPPIQGGTVGSPATLRAYAPEVAPASLERASEENPFPEVGYVEAHEIDANFATEKHGGAAIVEDRPPAVDVDEKPQAETPVESKRFDSDLTIPRNRASSRPEPSDFKRVKLRSTSDIMRELDSLRKQATQTPSKPTSGPSELKKSVNFSGSRKLAGRARAVRLQLTFEDEHGKTVQEQDQRVRLDTLDENVQNLLIKLKIDLSS